MNELFNDKNYFKQYIPAFVSGVEPDNFEFDSLEELLDHPRVKQWRMCPFDFDKPSPPGYFHQYSLNDNRLMVEIKYGKEWYVIGYVKHPERLDLPKWERKDK